MQINIASVTRKVYCNTPAFSTFNFQFCEGDSIKVNGVYYSNNTIFADTLSSTYGCDSLLYYVITKNSNFNIQVNASICDGDSVLINGIYYSDNAAFTDTLSAATGCDSLVQYIITKNPTYSIQNSASICDGDSVFFGGLWQTQAGWYVDSYTSSSGCDSVVNSALTVNPVSTVTDSVTLLQGDSIFVGGAWQTASGVYADVFLNQLGCDSIVVTVLNVITSINSMDGSSFISIIPNPAKNLITVKLNFSSAGDVQLSIKTIDGQTVLRQQIKSKQTSLNISSLAPGIFIVQVGHLGKLYYSRLSKRVV